MHEREPFFILDGGVSSNVFGEAVFGVLGVGCSEADLQWDFRSGLSEQNQFNCPAL